MTAPEEIRRRAAELGFSVTGWSEDAGAVDGNGQAFIGTHREIEIFLAACAAARMACAFEMSRDLKGHDLMTFSTRGDPGILPGETRVFVNRPQRTPFLGLRLAIQSQIADRFDVEIRVGNQSVMGPAPGFVFSARTSCSLELLAPAIPSAPARVEISRAARASFGGALRIPPCRTAQDFILVATRHEDRGGAEGQCEFSAVVLGESTLEAVADPGPGGMR